MKKDGYHYEKLAEQMEHMDKKAMDRLKQNLRDSYLQLKDLSHRCLIDISNIEKNDKRIFYFKPESVLLEDPETQRHYRENLIKKLSTSPQISQNPSLAQELSKEMQDTMQDLTEPDIVRDLLAQFFQRRLYNLQHKKYKILLRWAHFALTSEYLDRIGHHGTFTYGRLQYELENAIKRYERLSQDDDYGSIRDGEKTRPRTKGTDDEVSASMYNEKPRKDPLSCIRMDDFEIYLRQQTYEVKLFRTVEKFIARIKWLPLSKRYDMFKESHVLLKNEYETLYNEQIEFEKRIRKRFDSSNIRKSDDLIIQMEEILQIDYITSSIQPHLYRTKAPVNVSNLMELQLRIQERAAEFKIFGDIELDEGHSFTYQVNIFFTTYFQRQIIKSQFSLYDSTVRDMKDAYESNEPIDDEVGDINEIQRRNLKSLMLIDFQMIDYFNSNQDQANLFLLKKGKKINEQIPELKKNFQDIIVIRLKKAYWLTEVMLKPRVDENMRRQNAIFSFEYTPDLLLQSIQDFIDINDISSINTIYSDLTSIYQQLLSNQDKMLENVNKIIQHSLISDQHAKKLLEHFRDALKLHQDENEHLHRLELSQQNSSDTKKDTEQKNYLSKNSILRILPKHYIQSLYTLRHMKTRDTKTKLLYVLNFFRAVQKRITLDLREFAGREVVSENADSNPPQEATYTGKNSSIVTGNINYSFKPGKEEDKQEFSMQPKRESKIDKIKNKTDNLDQQEKEDDEEELDEQYDKTNLLDIKKWKLNGQFHVHMLQTCPIIPTFHSTHGEPLQDKFMQQDFTDSKSTTKTHITRKSASLLTRMDTFKIEEESKEIYVIDDFGMHIMYDCALEDMVQLDKEVIKIGTFFVRKNEQQFDFKQYKFPLVERFQLLEDIMNCEFDFHYEKAKLVMAYLEAYEHICDPLEQQRMMQIMVDLMSARPRIDYQNSDYFIESYRAEIICYQTQYKLLREIIDYQMKAEKKENQNIRDYLHMTYKIANQYVNKQWSDANQEEIKKEVKTRQVIQGGMRFQDLQEIQEQLKNEENTQNTNSSRGILPDIDNINKNNNTNNNDKQQDSNVDKFAEILGLKGISMETMLKSHIRTDETAEEVMNQDANFIKTQEGYPILMRESNDSLSKVKFTNYSNQIGVLDFYESLTVIPKVYSAVNVVFQEIEDCCMPANQLQLIALHTIYLEKCFVEFKKCIAYSQDELIEYKGSQYIENDLIMSSPDKMMFLIKDMIAHLSRTYKKSLNPFFVSKLDFYTINNFQFPDMLKEQMQTQLRLDVNFSRNFIETQLQNKGGQARFFPKLREDDRKVNVPPMLLVFCNLVEVIRLREQMITNLSETQVLTDIYTHLRDLVNRSNYKLLFQNQLIFETFTVSKEQINFVEDGSLTDVDIDLAINEYDTNLRSNLNFMNAESFQCLVLDGGVSELRGATVYQVLQKQLLIVAVRTNMKIMNSHLRALAELELFQQHRIKIENSVIDYKQLQRLNGTVSEDLILQARSKCHRNMNYEIGEEFVQILPIKQGARTIVEKKFKQTVNQLTSFKDAYNEHSSIQTNIPNYSVARVMRDYKLSLLYSFCTQVCKMNTIEATKYEMINNNWQMKKMMNLFPKEIVLFSLQDNEGKESFFQNQYFDKQSAFEEGQYFTNFETGEIQSLLIIPSYKTILTMQNYTQEEKKQIEEITTFDQCKKQLEFQTEIFKRTNIDEINLKQKMRKLIISLNKQGGNDQNLISSQITLGRLQKLQKTLLEILELNFWFARLSMHPVESIQMEIAAEKMLPFWQSQDTQLEDQLLTEVDDEGLGEKIMKKLIYEKKQKQSLNDEMEQLAKTMNSIFIKMISDIVTCTLPECLEYLSKYCLSLNYKVTAGILNVLNSYYLKNKPVSSLMGLHWGLRELTRVDFIVPTFSNGTVMHYKNLDPYQRQLNFTLKNDQQFFQQTIKGLKAENELIRPEFILLQDIVSFALNHNSRANYPGQVFSRQYRFLNSMNLGMEKDDVIYLSSEYNSIDQNIKELLELDKIINEASMYSLLKRTNYIQDIIKSKMLYFGLMILISGQSLALNQSDFQQQLKLYKNEVNWKVENEFQKKLNKFSNKKPGDPKQTDERKHMQGNSIKDDRIKRQAIQSLDNNIQKAAAAQYFRSQQRELQTQQIRQGNIMQKAIIKMSIREIERRLIKIAIEAITNQMSAISKTLEMTSKNLDNSGNAGFIGSMQNFAPTFFDHVNKNAHLEVVNRVSHMQLLLTKIRNRGMDIETLTSGPGIVFTYKDLNECLQSFCTDAISHQEKELKSRTKSFQNIINHQKHLIYIKDRRVDALKRKLKLVYENITRIVNSRIYEKGNTLIFELDRALREKRFYQDHIYVFENEMKEFVREEFRLLLQRKDLALDIQKKQMRDVGNQLVSEVKFHVLNEQKRIKKQIKSTARKMRDLDNFHPQKQKSIIDNKRISLAEMAKSTVGNISNINNNEQNNNNDLNDDEWIISPEEATRDMLKMQQLLVKQRTLWMLRFQTQQKMYEDQIQNLKNKLTSNTALWDQLQESDKRTKILQQELTFTQKSLSQCEKIIEKLKEELKQSEQERVRLFQYKQNKAQRLEELEHQVKKIDISEHINITKVIDMLTFKDKELNNLKRNEKHFEDRLNQQLSLAEKEKQKLKSKLNFEVDIKQQVLQKMQSLRGELQGFEQSNNTDKDVVMWKTKCKELLDICQNLSDENQLIGSRLKTLTLVSNNDLKTMTDLQENIKVQESAYLSNIKSRNQNLDKEAASGSNLFASEKQAGYLPNIKNYLSSSMNQPSQIEQQNYPPLSSQTLSNQESGIKLTNLLNNSSVLGIKRMSEVSPFKANQSEYSDYNTNLNLSEQINSQNSYTNLVGVMPIKPIKPIQSLNQQLLINSAKSQSKNVHYYKNKMIQKRNVSNNSYSNYISAYDNNAQHSTSISGVSNNMSSDRHKMSKRNLRGDQYSLPREVYHQTERNLNTAEGKNNSYYDDLQIRGMIQKRNIL